MKVPVERAGCGGARERVVGLGEVIEAEFDVPASSSGPRTVS